MKKKLMIGLLTIAIAGLVSCKKEQATMNLGTAVIKGKITANLNEANDTIYGGSYELKLENAAGIASITFIIDAGDLDNNPQWGYTYQKITKTVTTDGSGNYTVDLQCAVDPMNVEMLFSDFEYDVVEWGTEPGDTLPNGNPATVTKRGVFSCQPLNTLIYENGSFIIDATYTRVN